MKYFYQILLLLAASVQAICDVGFVHMTNSIDDTVIEECSSFNPEFAEYPISLDNKTKGSKVLDIYPKHGCDSPEDPKSYKERILIMKRHPNCTFAARARIVEKAGGTGVLIVSEDGLTNPGGNKSEYAEIDITVALITNISHEEFASMISRVGIDNVYIKQYAPGQNHWDPNSFIMWILAVFTCALGAWVQCTNYASQLSKPASTKRTTGSGEAKQDDSKDEVNFTALHAFLFFGMCSVSILLMYFFYKYLVYIIISIFCLASCLSTFDLLYGMFENSTCFTRHRIPPNGIPFCRSRPPIFGVLLFLCCAAFSVFWAVNRKEDYAWILQDVLGFTFCVHMIKQIRLPSFKVSCILLVLFFLYDIFYVFVTPLLTKNKESIMVNIATGGDGDSKEELPMLFKLPRFLPSPYAKCGPVSYSMLGYGDVILPGLHVGFCAIWDFRISNTVRRHAYFIAAVIGYGSGLVLTFVGMYIMMMGQPALLYLTPSCLISTLLVALKRNELKAIWNGALPTRSQVAPHIAANGTISEEEALLVKTDA